MVWMLPIHTDVAIHTFMWNLGKTCGSLDAIPSLQWEVAKVKQLMTSNMTLTALNLHQMTPKGATTKIQVKRYKRDKSIRYPRRDIK